MLALQQRHESLVSSTTAEHGSMNQTMSQWRKGLEKLTTASDEASEREMMLCDAVSDLELQTERLRRVAAKANCHNLIRGSVKMGFWPCF